MKKRVRSRIYCAVCGKYVLALRRFKQPDGPLVAARHMRERRATDRETASGRVGCEGSLQPGNQQSQENS